MKQRGGRVLVTQAILSSIDRPTGTAFHACNPEKACDGANADLRGNARMIHALSISFGLVSDLAMPLTKAALLITNVFDVLRTH